MPYFTGNSLSQLLKQNPDEKISEQKLRDIVIPLLNGLKVLHAQNIFHRDIKPSNIYICNQDTRPILIDFGAARFSLGSRSRSITTIVTPCYSPHEQYHQHGKQGAWTDIYSMGAVMYRLISGKKPIESPARVADDDPLIPATTIGKGRYSKHLLTAIDHALAFKEIDRPQSIEQWLLEIDGKKAPKAKKDSKPIPIIAWVVIVTLIASAVLLGLKLLQGSNATNSSIKYKTEAIIEPTTKSNVEKTIKPTISPPTETEIKIKIKPTIEEKTAPKTVTTCVDSRLNSAQIKTLVQNKIAIGVRLDTPTPYNWVEFQKNNGEAYFNRENGEISTGKWKIDADQLCWCYGECIEYKCKYIEARNSCSIWYYIDPETGKETSKVYRWKEPK
jgi:serine/threonine protein kinase